MSAESFAQHMPRVFTLDFLMAALEPDEFHRYELSPEGVLSAFPNPGSTHALVVTRVLRWLGAAGIPVERFAHAVGLRIPGEAADGGRIPDVVVWRAAPTPGTWLPATEVSLVVEVVAAGSEGMDVVIKRHEYASAGIPQYWVVDRNEEQTVTLYRLDGQTDAVRAIMPLAWVLRMSPAEHDLV